MDKNAPVKAVQTLADVTKAHQFSETDTDILRMLDEGLDVSFGLLNHDLRYVFISQHSYRLLGITRDDVDVGDHITTMHNIMIKNGLLTPEMMKDNELSVEHKTNRLTNINSEIRRMKMGNGHTVEFTRVPLSNGYIAAIAHDVSDLAEKDALLTQALAIGKAGYWTYSFKDKSYTVNSTFAYVLSDEHLANVDKYGILAIIHPEDRHLFKAAIKGIKKNKGKIFGQYEP